MNINNLKAILDKVSVTLFEFGHDTRRDFEFIENLYTDEEYPIFEHSPYHALSYLNFESALYGIEGEFGSAILVLRGEKWFLFTPKVNNGDKFEELLKAMKIGSGDIEIQNVSNQWIDEKNNYFKNGLSKNLKVMPRSKEEAVYDVEMLNRMEGKHFANLRQFRNKLIDRGIIRFEDIDEKNVGDALGVLSFWQKVQGYKYQKNKFEKEKFVIKRFSEFSKEGNVVCVIGKVNKRPISIGIMHKVPGRDGWGVIYMVKGINRSYDGGTHGVSDATYIHLFRKAGEMGIKFLNDGELGSEEGTRAHKQYFLPIKYLKSYDLFVH